MLSGLAVLFLAVILVFAASRSDVDLDGTAWTVEQLVVDGDDTALIAGTTITVAFADGTVAGSGGCNNYQGSYEVDGDRLVLGPLVATQRFCDDPAGISDQEFVFFALLDAVDSHSVDDGRLVLATVGTPAIVLEPHDD